MSDLEGKRVYRVVLMSDLYGRENFDYDTINQALAGIRRLYRACSGDGIERIVGLVANEELEAEYDGEDEEEGEEVIYGHT